MSSLCLSIRRVRAARDWASKRRWSRKRANASETSHRTVMEPTYVTMEEFSIGLNDVKKRSASSAEKVLNVIEASSASKSSSVAGKRRTLKSVKWLHKQWRKPSASPPGGGETTQPRVLYSRNSSSQNAHSALTEQSAPRWPSVH
eukprot:scaffold326792_cov49-Tisochrysis_lutea.AAC.1